MKKTVTFIIVAFSLNACVSNRVFNDLESRYADLKTNFNQQTKTIESLNAELKDLTDKFVAQETALQQVEDSLNQKQQKLEQMESSLDLLKLNCVHNTKTTRAIGVFNLSRLQTQLTKQSGLLVTSNTCYSNSTS